MGAIPIILMFIGLDMQGDLPPRNRKPLHVVVGCMNTFTTALFMYATTWDSYDNRIITTHHIHMWIMIIMCVWCVILMVLYALHPTYAGVVWLKPLADYVPPTKAKSMQRLVPTQSKYAVKPEPQPEPTPRARWVPRPRQESCGYRHMDVAWDPAPAPSDARRRQLAPIDNDAASVEYRLGYRRLAGPGEGQQPREEVVIPDGGTQATIFMYQGSPVKPDTQFELDVAYVLGCWVLLAYATPLTCCRFAFLQLPSRHGLGLGAAG